MPIKFLRAALLLAAAMVLAGCGGGSSGPPLYEVSGTVMFDGKPVEDGRIVFRKTDGDKRAFSGEIKEGSYELTTEAGKMEVVIRASRIIPGKFDNSNGTPEPVGEMYIPAKYNSKTTLTKEVSDSGSNEFDFELTSK